MAEPVRVLISGMGGEHGTRVAQLLDAAPWVDELVGFDLDPPRSRLRRATFHLIDPTERARAAGLVRFVDPTHVVHLGVYEPWSRSTPAQAERRNALSALHVLGAAAEGRSLRAIVVRSGLEVYGRGRHTPLCPDETVPLRPTSPFGRQLVAIEEAALAAGRDAEVPVTRLRFASVIGAHVPNPLGRLLRLSAVPVSALADPPFTLCHLEDAAQTVVSAVQSGVDVALNVAGPGAVTPVQAVRMGRRVPLPVAGPAWMLTRALTQLLGAPVPDHVVELLRRGRGADTSLAREVLEQPPVLSVEAVVRQVYDWETVRHGLARAEA